MVSDTRKVWTDEKTERRKVKIEIDDCLVVVYIKYN